MINRHLGGDYMDTFKLMNLKETAKILRVSPHTLRAWTSRKLIPVIRIGRRILFSLNDIENLINKSRDGEPGDDREK